MLSPRSTKAIFNALQNGAPDLQRVVLDPSASTANASEGGGGPRPALHSKRWARSASACLQLECTVSPRLPRYLLKFEVMACYELCIRVVKKKSCALCSLVKSGYASHAGTGVLQALDTPFT